MKKLNLNYLIFLVVIFSSCSTVGVSVSKKYPPKESNCVLDIYFSENEIEKDFEVIALIDSKTGTTAFADKSVSGAIELAKPKACECGADAIIVVQAQKNDVTYGSWGMGFAIIKCIKYK